MNSLTKILADRVKDLRKKAGFPTQKAFIAELHEQGWKVDSGQWSKFESSGSHLTIDRLPVLARALGITIAELFPEETDA